MHWHSVTLTLACETERSGDTCGPGVEIGVLGVRGRQVVLLAAQFLQYLDQVLLASTGRSKGFVAGLDETAKLVV